jgi:deazaflavin-dependent oxidoreductase (nitroreductase family)
VTAARYRLSAPRRALNAVVRPLARAGLVPRTYVLTVVGRRSGRRYSVPVQLVEQDGARFLVAPYGEREWVKNARAAGEVELARARRTEHVPVHELAAAEAAPVLAAYWRQAPVTRPFFDVRPDAPAEQWTAEATRHPVFRLG